jgi:2'-5' RNA ligase
MTSVANPDEARFFIAIMPPIEIQDYANSLIQELRDRYSTRTSPSSPHITLQAPFLWQMADLVRLETYISQFAQHQPAVSIKLIGFGSFAPHVLYIDVLKSPELLTLQSCLATYLKTHLGIVAPIARPFSPHMTVASRNLTPSTFQQAWSDLQLRQAKYEFVSDRLTLLLHDGQCWQMRSQFLLSLT